MLPTDNSSIFHLKRICLNETPLAHIDEQTAFEFLGLPVTLADAINYRVISEKQFDYLRLDGLINQIRLPNTKKTTFMISSISMNLLTSPKQKNLDILFSDLYLPNYGCHREKAEEWKKRFSTSEFSTISSGFQGSPQRR